MLHQNILAAAVPLVHAAQLGHGHMAFINQGQGILGEEIQQRGGGTARQAAGKMAGIILNPLAEAQFFNQLQIVIRTQFQALRFQKTPMLLKPSHAVLQLRPDGLKRRGPFFRSGHVLLGREKGVTPQPFPHAAGGGINQGNPFHLVSEKLHADRLPFRIGGKHLHHLPAHAERAAGKIKILPLKQAFHQLPEEHVPVHDVSLTNAQGQVTVSFRGGQAVNAGDGRHHNHVPARHQGIHGVQAQAVQLVIDGGILLDISVGTGDVRLRLVIVEIGNVVIHRVIREKAFQLRVKLRGERLVVGNHQRGPVHPGDQIRHRERLAAPGHPQQALVLVARLQRLEQLADGLLLVPGGLEGGI